MLAASDIPSFATLHVQDTLQGSDDGQPALWKYLKDIRHLRKHSALGCGAAANPPRKQQKPRNLCVHGPYDDDGDTDDDDHHHDW